MNKLLQILILFSFPLREAVGFNLGMPVRLGELLMYVYAMYVIVTLPSNKVIKKGLVNKNGFKLLLVLLINMIITAIVSMNLSVDMSFFIKYIFRNLAIMLFILGVVLNPFDFEDSVIEKFFKYIIILQIIICIIQVLGIDISFSKLVEYSPQKYFGFTRLKGTASEPGYLPAIIVPSIYYFRNKKKCRKYYYSGILILFFTFSSFSYIVIALELLIVIISKIKTKRISIKNFISLITISIGILTLGFFIITNDKNNKIEEVVKFNLEKITNFVMVNEVDYSSSSRIQQSKLALEHFKEGSTINKLLGQGTGSYARYSNNLNNGFLIESAEEAHNLYVSTLHDRGILGIVVILIIICLTLSFSRDKKSTLFTRAMKYSMVVQIIHWTITGNMWLYYFWICAGICLSNDIKYLKLKGLNYKIEEKS